MVKSEDMNKFFKAIENADISTVDSCLLLFKSATAEEKKELSMAFHHLVLGSANAKTITSIGEKLKQAGLNINVADKSSGYTPLQALIVKTDKDVCEKIASIVNLGAKVDEQKRMLPNEHGKPLTAANIAFSLGKWEAGLQVLGKDFPTVKEAKEMIAWLPVSVREDAATMGKIVDRFREKGCEVMPFIPAANAGKMNKDQSHDKKSTVIGVPDKKAAAVIAKMKQALTR